MEFVESWRRHYSRTGFRDGIPHRMLSGTQWVGNNWRNPLPDRYALQLRCFYNLPCPVGSISMERTATEVGSCRHLLAHCRFLFPHHAHCSAQRRAVGMGTLRIRLVECRCRNRFLTPPTQISQPFRDACLCRDGAVCTDSFQASAQRSQYFCHRMDDS